MNIEKIGVVVVVLALLVGFSSCNSSVSRITEESARGKELQMLVVTKTEMTTKIIEPEMIASQVFEILRNLNFGIDDADKKFANNFPAFEVMSNFEKTDKVTTHLAIMELDKEMTREMWEEKVFDSFIDLGSLMLADGIYWSNIVFENFKYELKPGSGGEEFVFGELAISHNDFDFKVNSLSIWNGEEYLLLQLDMVRVDEE